MWTKAKDQHSDWLQLPEKRRMSTSKQMPNNRNYIPSNSNQARQRDCGNIYIWLTANSFKSRFNNHNSNFNNIEQRNAATLSEHIWNLQDKDIRYTINWKIISKVKPYSTSSKKCNSCTEGKYFIIYRPGMSSLNKRNELTSKCRHRKKHLLCEYK